MKKFIGLVILLMSAFLAFAKEIPLQVTETEWGWEISNLDVKGKRICKGFLDFKEQENVYVILKTNADTFSVEKLANGIVYDNLPNIVSLSGENLLLVNKDKKTQLYGSLSNYDSILVVSLNGKIERCSAFCDGKNLCLRISEQITDCETQVSLLVKKYSEEKRIEDDRQAAEQAARQAEQRRIMLISDLISDFKRDSDAIVEGNDLYIYTLRSGGGIAILAYIGSSADNLIIPSKIEGIPVMEICNNAFKEKYITIKSVTIPACVESIGDGAFYGIDLEKVVFESNSKIKHIGFDAFRDNNLSEISIPKKTIIIKDNAFSENKIKKISIYKGWRFESPVPRGTMVYGNHKSAVWQSSVLEEVFYEDGCEEISEAMFRNCTNLKRLRLPASIRTIRHSAFENCSNLSQITFGGNISFESTYFLSLYYVKCFKDCPLDLKTRNALLNMGLPKDAF